MGIAVPRMAKVPRGLCPWASIAQTMLLSSEVGSGGADGHCQGTRDLHRGALAIFLVTAITIFGEHAFLVWLAVILLVAWGLSSLVVWPRSK
jgi:hypothetical protein